MKVTSSQCLFARAASTIPIVFIQLAIEIPSAKAEDIGSPNQQSSLTPRGAAPVTLVHIN